jgi:hypothetical protein
MDPQTLTNRVEILERKVEDLAELPDRMSALELQVSQLRSEMRIEFSAVRVEMRELTGGVRQEMHELNGGLRQEMHALNAGLRQEMHELNAGLRQEMHALNEETRRDLGGRIDDLGIHMRVLHEEVISRIALLDEHTNGRQSTRRSPARQPRKNRKLKG